MPTSEAVRAGYHDRLEAQIENALSAFRDVVTCCQIEEKAGNARRDFHSQVQVANLAKAADELLRLVSELKIAVIVQDVNESTVECQGMRSIYDQETRQSLSEMTELRGNVSTSLAALEKHYYTSCTRWTSKST